MKNLYTNRKAFHNYFIEEKFEAGIVLCGSEVKSCRGGYIDLTDAYVTIDNGNLVMHNAFISAYNHASFSNHEEKRKRILLMHKKEILKLYQKINIKGLTLIPISFYLKGGLIKVEVALAKGKHNYDKREALKNKTLKKELKNGLVVKN